MLKIEVECMEDVLMAAIRDYCAEKLAGLKCSHHNCEVTLYFCVNGAIQRINFVWGSDSQKPLAWSGKSFIPRAPRN